MFLYSSNLISYSIAFRYCYRALLGLSLLLALPKRGQKASAKPLGDLSNGLSPESNLRAIAPFDSTPTSLDRCPPAELYAQEADAQQGFLLCGCFFCQLWICSITKKIPLYLKEYLFPIVDLALC